MKGILLCPIFDETCPYCVKGMCYMAKKGAGNPLEECEHWQEEEDE